MIHLDKLEALTELKNRYVKDKVSLLVGAGFSKNAWAKFPMWNDLLKDMVEDMYGKRANVINVLKKHGNLNIVSEYIAKKGMREAIEDYIEQRIPYVDIKNLSLNFANGQSFTLSDSDLDIHKKLLCSRWEKIYTTNYDNLLESVAEKNNYKWKAISSAEDLTLNNETNSLIIKLHGTIYNPQKTDKYSFKFDGNYHHRYIISQEDYNNYPNEHEAFTQLMRISLLQGTFCLLGFSGNDPNFLSWITWVRDVLVRSSHEYNSKGLKVFLIDVSKNKLSSDTELFYFNHHIIHISLRDKEIMKELDVDKKIMESKLCDETVQNRHLIECFISYLNKDDELAQELGVSSKKVYSKLWGKTINSKNNSFVINSSVAKDIKERMSTNRTTTQTNYQKNFISKICKNKRFSADDITLVLIALRDTGLPISYYPNLRKKLSTAVSDDWQKKTLQSLLNRESTLNNKKIDIISVNDDIIYEKILQTAYNLDFENLYMFLLAWEPKKYYKIIKAVWMYMFDNNIYLKLLDEYKYETNNPQEEYWATELIKLSSFESSRLSTVKYENMGLLSIYNLRDDLVEQYCIEEKEKIEPYGQKSKTIYIGKTNIDYERAVKVLQCLIDFPLMPSIGIRSIIPAEKWYIVFKNLYEEHPFPALFYSITITDEKILKRVGQDFSYSDRLFNDGVTEIIVKKLFHSLLDNNTPNYLKKHIYPLLGEMLIVVKSSIWEKDFIHIWQQIFVPIFDKNDNSPEFDFIYKAVSFINDRKYIEKIIIDCLKYSKGNRMNSINILYSINKVYKFSNKNFSNEISTFIDNIDSLDDVQILGNINNYLTINDKRKLCNKILSLDKDKILISDMINALCYLTRYNTELKKLVKKAIINSDKLWHNGIIDDMGSTPIELLRIVKFDKILNWTFKETKQLYEKLIISANAVIKSKLYRKRNIFSKFLNDYDNLFIEMYKFIKIHKKQLEGIKGFKEQYAKIKRELYANCEFKDLEEGLRSNDRRILIRAINFLIFEIKNNNQAHNSYDECAEIIADRILFDVQEGFEVSIEALSYIVHSHYTKETLSDSLKHKLLLILKRNDKANLIDKNHNFIEVTSNLIILAKDLESFGFITDETQKWIEFEKTGRFNIRL